MLMWGLKGSVLLYENTPVQSAPSPCYAGEYLAVMTIHP